MDHNKNSETQPTQGHQGQQRSDRSDMDRNDMPSGDQNWSDQSPTTGNRDQAEGSREETRGGDARNMGGQEGGARSSGISNRGMTPAEEQADLPPRGRSDEGSLDQSER